MLSLILLPSSSVNNNNNNNEKVHSCVPFCQLFALRHVCTAAVNHFSGMFTESIKFKGDVCDTWAAIHPRASTPLLAPAVPAATQLLVFIVNSHTQCGSIARQYFFDNENSTTILHCEKASLFFRISLLSWAFLRKLLLQIHCVIGFNGRYWRWSFRIGFDFFMRLPVCRGLNASHKVKPTHYQNGAAAIKEKILFRFRKTLRFVFSKGYFQ